jgi:hypothetical protein
MSTVPRESVMSFDHPKALLVAASLWRRRWCGTTISQSFNRMKALLIAAMAAPWERVFSRGRGHESGNLLQNCRTWDAALFSDSLNCDCLHGISITCRKVATSPPLYGLYERVYSDNNTPTKLGSRKDDLRVPGDNRGHQGPRLPMICLGLSSPRR